MILAVNNCEADINLKISGHNSGVRFLLFEGTMHSFVITQYEIATRMPLSDQLPVFFQHGTSVFSLEVEHFSSERQVAVQCCNQHLVDWIDLWLPHDDVPLHIELNTIRTLIAVVVRQHIPAVSKKIISDYSTVWLWILICNNDILKFLWSPPRVHSTSRRQESLMLLQSITRCTLLMFMNEQSIFMKGHSLIFLYNRCRLSWKDQSHCEWLRPHLDIGGRSLWTATFTLASKRFHCCSSKSFKLSNSIQFHSSV